MFNIKLLFMINTGMLILLSFYLFSLYKKNKNNYTIRYLLYFSSLYTVGIILFLLRNDIPNFLSMVMANTLFAIANVNLYVAIKALLTQDTKWHVRYWIPVITFFIGFCIFTCFQFNADLRALLYTFFVLIYSIFIMRLFFLFSSQEFQVFDKISVIFFLFISLVYIASLVRIYFYHLSTYFFSNSDIFIASFSFHMMILNIWIVLLTHYRVKKI